jgi:hypothetical protein
VLLRAKPAVALVRIPGAVHVPAEALAGGLASVPVAPDRAVVAHCT